VLFADTGKLIKLMKYLSVNEFAKKWNLPGRTVRNYCATDKIKGASHGQNLEYSGRCILTGKRE
jgi:hypothetical protein